MRSPLRTTLSILPILPLVLTLPLSSTSTPQWPQWQIPTLSTHFMGPNSGIASGAWPDFAKFNSSIAFTLTIPSPFTSSAGGNSSGTASTNCAANWTPGAPPTRWAACEDERVSWMFEDGARFEEARFTLGVMVDVRSDTAVEIFRSSVAVSSNNGTDPTSYLTCLGGAPLTGIHCAMDGVMSVPGLIMLTPTWAVTAPLGRPTGS